MTMAPSINPFVNASYSNGYHMPTSPASHLSNSFGASATASASGNNALVVYSPTSLYGLYYNEHVHGPFATGLQANPFTPGLSPVNVAAKPSYAVEDPVRARFPASRAADDPLNWITDEVLNMG
ncbi:hypothetical protein PLESTF_001311200 [Pleodorina starrii]|nr:hypothetical protein PLESTM_000501300 [Pleodorina starrii]GLC72934.1 hypothetical protein PLESTF_001311200 [Pleodorina starrii]